MRQALILGVLTAVVCAGAGAQVVTDIPLPPNLPTVTGAPSGPTQLSIQQVVLFAEHDALAFADGATIHRWTGLPSAPVYSSLTLLPHQKMSHWSLGWRLDRDVLLYWSVGQDLQPGTGDERLCLIRGLPYAPQVIVTQIGPAQALPYFFPVRPGLAVNVSSNGFQVLQHGANGATVQSVPVPGGLPFLGAGRVDAGTVAAYFGGNGLVLLRGLDGAGPWVVENAIMPGVASFTAFIVSDDGVGVGINFPNLPTVQAHVVQIPPVSGPLTVTPLSWTGPTSPVCTSVCSAYLTPVPGGGAEIRTWETGGSGFCVLGNLRQAPVIKYSSGYIIQTVSWSAPLSEDEVCSTSMSAVVGSLSYARWAPGGTQTVSVGGLTNYLHIGFVRLGRGALVDVWQDSSAQTAQFTVVRDALGATAASTFSIAGMFTRTFSLGGAAVGGFVAASPGFASPTTLRIVSAPRAGVEALANPTGAPSLQLTVTPGLGSISQGVNVAIQANPAWPGPALVVATSSRETVGRGFPGIDGLVFLDLATSVQQSVIPVDASGLASLTAPPGSLPPALSGVPIYFQSAVLGGGLVRVSDLGTIILGP